MVTVNVLLDRLVRLESYQQRILLLHYHLFFRVGDLELIASRDNNYNFLQIILLTIPV